MTMTIRGHLTGAYRAGLGPAPVVAVRAAILMALINGHQMAAGQVFDTIMAIAYRKRGVGTQHTWFSVDMCRDCPPGEFCTIKVGIGIKHVTIGPRGGKKVWWTDEHRVYVTKGEIEAMLREYPLSGILGVEGATQNAE